MSKPVDGFSKLTKDQKIDWIQSSYQQSERLVETFRRYRFEDERLQNIFDGFSENTISNFTLPFGVAPNFLIDGHWFLVPMVIEESSVVAAAAAAAKYWMTRGGFKTTILGTTKVGHIHFKWKSSFQRLMTHTPELEKNLLEGVSDLTSNMTARGGGIRDIEWLDFSEYEPYLFQLRVSFETCDSMGANFINSILEKFAAILEGYFLDTPDLVDSERDIEIIMSILSNYTPQCIVRSEVSCPLDKLSDNISHSIAEDLAEKFRTAIKIAQIDPYRATTHNKGIFNGVDAVVLATGNDFRAIEAAGHAYAARSGQYRSLSDCTIEDGVFRFWIDIPLAVGTVGGLTQLHPLAHSALALLNYPSAQQLMRIIASVGLAQNFAAVRSLVTTGIQHGHMKMHLMNILNHLNATDAQKNKAISHFSDKTITFADVRSFLDKEMTL